MAQDDERKRIERLQALARAQWPQPRAVALDGPGPFELPLCGHVSTLGRGSDPTFVLVLETTKESQPIHIPIVNYELAALKGLVDYLFQQYAQSVESGPTH